MRIPPCVLASSSEEVVEGSPAGVVGDREEEEEAEAVNDPFVREAVVPGTPLTSALGE